jgi:hypothetical protein
MLKPMFYYIWVDRANHAKLHFIYKIPYLVTSDVLDTKGYVQYNYDAGTSQNIKHHDGTSLHWYELTMVRLDMVRLDSGTS